jgi:predicted transcriptional regulator with HTH domain
MLIKTEDFDKTFNKNLAQISVVRFPPPYIRGSYSIKSYGSVITDIDLQQRIHISEGFLKRLVQIIDTSKNFIFIKLDCGIYEEFVPPWAIGKEGGCNYNPKEAKKWFEELGQYKIVDDETYKLIGEKLFSDEMSLKNLLEIREIYRSYSQIKWSREDIRDGYKIVRGKKYELLALMKKGHTTVMKFVYRYDSIKPNDFCHIDFSLMDPKYKNYPAILHDYYANNQYKIFKSYKWYLKDEYRTEFSNVIKSIENISGLLNRIKLYNTVRSTNLISPLEVEYILKDCITQSELLGITFTPETSKEAVSKLNKMMAKTSSAQIKYFRKKLQAKYEPMLISYEMRSEIAKSPVSQKVLQERFDKGLECPFFTIINTDFNYLYDLSQRVKLDPMMVLQCMKSVSDHYDTHMTVLINTIFNKNNWSISIEGEKYVVKEGTKVLKIFSDIRKAQKFILFG